MERNTLPLSLIKFFHIFARSSTDSLGKHYKLRHAYANGTVTFQSEHFLGFASAINFLQVPVSANSCTFMRERSSLLTTEPLKIRMCIEDIINKLCFLLIAHLHSF